MLVETDVTGDDVYNIIVLLLCIMINWYDTYSDLLTLKSCLVPMLDLVPAIIVHGPLFELVSYVFVASVH